MLCGWKGVGRAGLRPLLARGPEGALKALRETSPDGEPGPDITADLDRTIAEASVSATHIGRPDYPPLLAAAPDPPAALFYTGDISVLSRFPCVAVIGSRRCSIYGRRMARRLAGGLASAGMCVVSGMARGIDGESHAGALAGGGATAAVLGSGPDVLYPRRNASLAEEIRRKGCVLSEYPPGTSPEPFRFPERNRIISGVSLGVVVVEAGSRSGTMITVGTALDQGREVMAVPGDATRPTAAGSNRLLREGAAPVTTAEEVLEVLGVAPRRAEGGQGPEEPQGLAGTILGMLDDGPAHVDELARATGAGPGELREQLLRLELAGYVIQRPGGVYARV